MRGRGARHSSRGADAVAPETNLHLGAENPAVCWLCDRALGRRVEWHHPTPRSRGGRLTVPVHPICHRTIHVTFTNAELERLAGTGASLAMQPALHRFLVWIAGKDPDFHAPTRR